MEEYSTNKAGKYLASKYFCRNIIIPLNGKASKTASETVLGIHSRPENLLAPHLKCLMIFLKETELRQSLILSSQFSSLLQTALKSTSQLHSRLKQDSKGPGSSISKRSYIKMYA